MLPMYYGLAACNCPQLSGTYDNKQEKKCFILEKFCNFANQYPFCYDTRQEKRVSAECRVR